MQRPFGKSRPTCKGNLPIYLKELGNEVIDWIDRLRILKDKRLLKRGDKYLGYIKC
jgi:hypothetical protein